MKTKYIRFSFFFVIFYIQGESILKKKIYIYQITLTNGEQLKNIQVEDALESKFSGLSNPFISVEDSEGKTVVLSKYQIVKAELVSVKE